jgi:hypothetical protein
MTTYTINLSNGDLLATLVPQAIDIVHAPITLYGQGTINYGQIANNNLVKLAENFCSDVAPNHPLTGTLWYDSAFSIFRVWNGAAWIGLRPETSPSNAGVAHISLGSTTVVCILSHGKIVATISDSAVNQLSLPSQLLFRDVNYSFSSRFPNGIGMGISISSDIELSQGDNTDTLVTSKWVKSQNYVSTVSSGIITTALGYTPLNPANNLSDVANASSAISNLGLGSMALQNPNSISVAGGAIDGTTIGSITPSSGVFTTIATTGSQNAKYVLAAPTGSSGAPTWRQLTSADISGVVTTGNALVPANNLSDIVSASTARTNLGLGTISTQAASSVTITGGTINGSVIGGTTAAAGTFTTVSLTSSQTQHFALAAPSGSSGAPSFRQLVSSDISGLGTISSQAASSVTISGGTINGTDIGNSVPAAGSFTNIDNAGVYKVLTTQVVSARQAGWSASTGTSLRTGFDTATATTSQIAQTLKALIDDLTTHGLIGS